ncbi:MAG: helix-turn-helix transcriptional regulator [Agathobacter sp.]|nr:helix-turn-helix transcriptional regulator [Agathobacter sp.]
MIKDLSTKLKELRMSQNLSQADVAKKLEISPSIVSGYETGERTPSTENLLALSYLYKCSTDYLLGKSNDKPTVTLDTDGLNQEQIQALQTLIKTMKHE